MLRVRDLSPKRKSPSTERNSNVQSTNLLTTDFTTPTDNIVDRDVAVFNNFIFIRTGNEIKIHSMINGKLMVHTCDNASYVQYDGNSNVYYLTYFSGYPTYRCYNIKTGARSSMCEREIYHRLEFKYAKLTEILNTNTDIFFPKYGHNYEFIFKETIINNEGRLNNRANNKRRFVIKLKGETSYIVGKFRLVFKGDELKVYYKNDYIGLYDTKCIQHIKKHNIYTTLNDRILIIDEHYYIHKPEKTDSASTCRSDNNVDTNNRAII